MYKYINNIKLIFKRNFKRNHFCVLAFSLLLKSKSNIKYKCIFWINNNIKNEIKDNICFRKITKK